MLGVQDHQKHTDGDTSGHNREHPPAAVLGTALALPSLSFPAEFPDLRGKQPPTSSHPSPNQVQHHGPKPPNTPFGTTQGLSQKNPMRGLQRPDTPQYAAESSALPGQIQILSLLGR